MCVRACLCFCVSDPDSYRIWHKVVVFWRLCPVSCSNSFPVMAGRTSAPRCSQPWLLQYLHVYAHNFHLLFLEQSAAEAWRETRGTAVSRAQLGFHDWEAGPDYARLGWRGVVGGEGGWWIWFSFLQGLPKVFDGGLEVSEGLWGSVRACPRRDASLGWDQSLRPAREPTGSGRAH